jgi:hypothetical protein
MTDVFHAQYRELSDNEKSLMEEIKLKAGDLYNLFENVATTDNGREIALAKTKLEESVMWAVKGLTK